MSDTISMEVLNPNALVVQHLDRCQKILNRLYKASAVVEIETAPCTMGVRSGYQHDCLFISSKNKPKRVRIVTYGPIVDDRIQIGRDWIEVASARPARSKNDLAKVGKVNIK